MASVKRELPLSDEQLLKKARIAESEPSLSAVDSNTRVVLNPADCDIDFNIERDGLLGSALHEEGFAYCWSGARANIGITRGKYCFGCKIVSSQPVDMEDTPLDLQHVCRVGVSRGDDVLRNLGETSNSFGYGGTGKFSSSGNFSDYGEKFGVSDTIVCMVDLESRPMATIGFSKNGKWLGVAKQFDAGPSGLGVIDSPIKALQWESAIFPHILLKNVVVQLQFSTDDGLILEEGYKPWDAAVLDGNAMQGPLFSDVSECEVIMMVGLPASGKSTWAEKWVNEHPEKRYILLGTNLVLGQMKVPSLLRKHNYNERFSCLMDRATKIFNALLSRASTIRRSFIIDQTNVFQSARKRKLKPFAYYKKIAAVVFPTAEELKSRAEKRFKEMGKEVPADAVNQMIANFTLPISKDMPRADEYFDQVWFVELNRAEAQRSLDEMKRETSVLMSSSSPSFQHCEKAPNQSYTGTSFHIQEEFAGSYGTQVPTLAYASFPSGMHHAGIYPQPSPLRPPPYVNLPVDARPPYGINLDYAQIGNFRLPSPMRPSANLVMDVQPPHGSFSHHVQNVGMYRHPPPRVMDAQPLLRPPPPCVMDIQPSLPPPHAMDVQPPLRPPPPRVMDVQRPGVYPYPPWGY
ncbi:hypothetical protein C2S52_013612 [Perilla frutescens var. hirtella]|nr:hypothetical protein C2S52_013612 [Perilla frutescens var. hirtella]